MTKKLRRSHFIGAAVVLVFLGICGTSKAQIGWMSPLQGRGISFSAYKTSFANEANLAFGTSVIFVSGRFPLGENFNLLIEQPISNYEPSELMVGNPCVGLEIAGTGSTSIFDLKVRVPLASDDKPNAAILGIYSFYDNFEAFAPKVTTISVSLGYRFVSSSGHTFKAWFGPTIMVPDGGNDADPETFADYNGELHFRAGNLDFGAGLNGRIWFTESGLSFGERNTNQAGFSGNLILEQLRLGFTLRLPLDMDLRNVVHLVYGVNLGVEI